MTHPCKHAMSAWPLHHELHLAIHSFTEAYRFRDALLWTDIGILEENRAYSWHAMINTRAKAVNCDHTATKPRTVCFTGADTSNGRACSFFTHLKSLEDAANLPRSGSLAQLAKTGQVLAQPTIYVAHDQLPQFPWIAERSTLEKPDDVDSVISGKFSVARAACIPSDYTGVMIPLVVRQGNRPPGLVGCIILCGMKTCDRLWDLLPRMKATALALLESRRDLVFIGHEDAFNPARKHIIHFLESYVVQPGKSYYPDTPDNTRNHDQAICPELDGNETTVFGRFYNHKDTKYSPAARNLLKALLCYTKLDSALECASDKTAEKVEQDRLAPLQDAIASAHYAFALSAFARLLKECDIQDVTITKGTVGSLPTTYGALALVGLLQLWYVLSAGDPTGAPLQTKIWLESDDSKFMSFTYALDEEKHGNLLRKLFQSEAGDIGKAIAKAVFGTFDVTRTLEEKETLLPLILSRRRVRPVMYPQFLPKQGGYPPRLVMEWALCEDIEIQAAKWSRQGALSESQAEKGEI